MPEKVEPLSFAREGLMVVLGCGEKIESEDGQRIGFERGTIFFSILGFMYYWVLEKKKILFFVLNDYWVLKRKKNQNFFLKIMLT